ncbi:MAG: 50S ribosomal protein L35 [Clostridiales bacterium]|nr:50S ribosomal protein L35 [Clostridiales bacterium]
MGKIKTHSASAKRFSLTKSGLVKMNSPMHRHKLGKKTSKRKHQIKGTKYLSESFAPTVRTLISK